MGQRSFICCLPHYSNYCLNHPHLTHPHPRKNCLPRIWPLVPKMLRDIGLRDKATPWESQEARNSLSLSLFIDSFILSVICGFAFKGLTVSWERWTEVSSHIPEEGCYISLEWKALEGSRRLPEQEMSVSCFTGQQELTRQGGWAGTFQGAWRKASSLGAL